MSGMSSHPNVGLDQEWMVDHVNNSVCALNVWAENMDGNLVPIESVTWNIQIKK